MCAVFQSLVLTSSSVERVVEPDVAETSTVGRQQERVRAVVKEACPKCNHPELEYYTMQCVREARTEPATSSPCAFDRGPPVRTSWSVAQWLPLTPPSVRPLLSIAGCAQPTRGRPSSTSVRNAAIPFRPTLEGSCCQMMHVWTGHSLSSMDSAAVRLRGRGLWSGSFHSIAWRFLFAGIKIIVTQLPER